MLGNEIRLPPPPASSFPRQSERRAHHGGNELPPAPALAGTRPDGHVRYVRLLKEHPHAAVTDQLPSFSSTR